MTYNFNMQFIPIGYLSYYYLDYQKSSDQPYNDYFYNQDIFWKHNEIPLLISLTFNYCYAIVASM